MNDLFYFLQVNLALLILFSLYLLINRKPGMPGFNRISILSLLTISLLLPLVSFQLEEDAAVMEKLLDFPATETALSFSNYKPGDSPEIANYQSLIAIWLYRIWLAGMLTGLLFFLISIFKKIKLIYDYGILKIDSQLVVPVKKDLQPFSFMNLIFLDLSGYDKKALKTLIIHESAHIRQFHFLDLIFIESFRLVFWYNPISWIVYRKIKENHEFLADQYVLKNGVNKLDYFQLILNQSDLFRFINLESSFSGFMNLKRFKMMNTNYKKDSFIKKVTISLLSLLLVFLSFGYLNAHTVPPAIGHSGGFQSEGPPTLLPIEKQSISFTSGYGMRMHPFKKVEMMHNGVDFAASKGTAVIATARGVIKETGYKPEGHGRYILIEHDENYSTFYSQLDEVNVEEGQKVNEKEIIGKVGSSGLSTGPHLHYEIREKGIAIDPSPYIDYE